jgi:hypothetical protein
MALLSLDLMVRRGEKVWYDAVECVPIILLYILKLLHHGIAQFGFDG